jgi:predicted ribosome quality control (RQC) complex YloA/Tae2 family protein
LQPVDFTTLTAIGHELSQSLLPARLEQVCQPDRFTVCLALRTLTGRQWLTLSWHPQAAHLSLGNPPPKQPDIFSFSQQLAQQLGGLALVEISPIAPWERVLDLRFAQRPGDPILWHLYVEIMGRYSNVVLANAENQIIIAAYQVSDRQSRLRSVQTGILYEKPPILVADTPNLTETFESWWGKITLIPGKLSKNLTSVYRGLSTSLVQTLLAGTGIAASTPTDALSLEQAHQIFDIWQNWLKALETKDFQPAWIKHDDVMGYTVMGKIAAGKIAAGKINPPTSIQAMVHRYYSDQMAAQTFQQLHHQIQQRLRYLLDKLYVKRQGFRDRLVASDNTEQVRASADLLMAHLHICQPGMRQIDLPDFETGEPIAIRLSPDKTAVQNAQALYKQHQKLKRSRAAIDPLIAAVQVEVDYLEQVATALTQMAEYQEQTDLNALEEIREELVQAGYIAAAAHKRLNLPINSAAAPRRFTSPNGYEILVGRNNRQNDQLTFRTANDYDIWFHSQQIPGSHVLLRIPAGSQPETRDLEYTANVAAYFSQGRSNTQVPIVYTQPKHVYKPKGAKLGMVIYKHETVIWGNPVNFLNEISV